LGWLFRAIIKGWSLNPTTIKPADCITAQPWILSGEPIRIVDAHRDGKRFIVRADEKLTAFVELESTICVSGDAYS